MLEREGLRPTKVKLPAIPRQMSRRAAAGDLLLSGDDDRLYRTILGKLLYLTTKTRPDISNAVRELSKHSDAPMEEHLKAAKQVVSYVLTTQEEYLSMKPDVGETYVEAYRESDFSGDPDTRRSVTGFVVLFCGVAVSWRSKAQRLVTLSSTVAEYVALTNCVQEVLFLRELLLSLQVEFTQEIVVHVDNIGAIYLMKNFSTTGRTKHIETRLHFIRELVEQGTIAIKFVRSSDNIADIFTKNVECATFDSHKLRFTCDISGEELLLREN